MFVMGGTAAFVLSLMDMLYYHGGPRSFFNLSQVGMTIFVVAQAFVLSRIYGETFKRNEQLLVLSQTDTLTQAANRLRLDHDLDKYHSLYQRYGTIYSLIMFDIDFFKVINDTYGHDKGDQVLIELSQLVQRSVRSCDHEFKEIGRLTASFSAVVPEERDEPLSRIFARMDEKLYEAKRLGRNRVAL